MTPQEAIAKLRGEVLQLACAAAQPKYDETIRAHPTLRDKLALFDSIVEELRAPALGHISALEQTLAEATGEGARTPTKTQQESR